MEKLDFPGQKEDEEVLLAFKQHPFVFAKSLLKSAPFFILSIYILITVDYPLLVILMFIVLVFSMSYLFYKWIIWQKNLAFVTNLRVISFATQKLFYQTGNETSFNQIIDVFYEIKGFFPLIFNFGNVKIVFQGGELNILNVKKPQKIKDQILEIVREVQENKKIAEAQAFVDLVEKIKK